MPLSLTSNRRTSKWAWEVIIGLGDNDQLVVDGGSNKRSRPAASGTPPAPLLLFSRVLRLGEDHLVFFSSVNSVRTRK